MGRRAGWGASWESWEPICWRMKRAWAGEEPSKRLFVLLVEVEWVRERAMSIGRMPRLDVRIVRAGGDGLGTGYGRLGS